MIEKELADHRVALRDNNTARIEAVESLWLGTMKSAFDAVTEHAMTLKSLVKHLSLHFHQVRFSFLIDNR